MRIAIIVLEQWQDDISSPYQYLSINSRNQIGMATCKEYNRLTSYVHDVLANLARMTALHVELFRAEDFEGCRRVDKDVERIVGEKERAIGALRQHMIEHRCQPKEPI